jgi:hypothetical protein
MAESRKEKVVGKKKINKYTIDECNKELNRIRTAGGEQSSYYREIEQQLAVLKAR